MNDQQTEFFRAGATPYAVNVVKHQRGHRMHDNSREVIRDERKRFSDRSAAILAVFNDAPAPMTDREVMLCFGWTDPNKTRPRISELIDAGLLRECGKTTDAITGKTVRLVEVVK
jgi:hypothetical protein